MDDAQRHGEARGQIRLLTTLQAGRAFAALAVVFNHTEIGTDGFVAQLPQKFRTLFEFGYLGVDFFFVLSGFIIYFACAQRAKNKAEAVSFLRNRLTRIFVPYWPITLVLVCAYAALPALSAVNREWGWPATLLLLPAAKPPALSVAWTLQHELVFYLGFSVLFFSGNLLRGAVLWVCAIAAAALIGAGGRIPASFFVGAIDLEFLFGILCAILATQSLRGPAWAYYGGAIASFAVYLWFGATIDHRVLFGLSIAFLIVPIVRLELAGKLSAPAWLVFVGNASYAIYLIHIPIISVTSRVAPHVPLLATWQGAMVFGVLASAMMGCLYHVTVERPGLTMVRDRLRKRAAVEA